MATVFPDDLENENNENLGQQNQGDISPQVGPSPSNQLIRPPSPKGSGRFMNLQKYIQANQPQAGQMASKIGGGIAERAGQAQSQIQEAQSRFGQQAGQEEQRLGQAGQFQQQLGQESGPQNILNSADQLAQFKQLQSGQLNVRPENLSQQQQQLSKLQEQAKLGQTEGGRFQLLRSQFGSPTYSLGQRRLDQLLLQSVPGAGQQFQSQVEPALSQLGQSLGSAQQDFTSRMTALQNLAGQAQSGIEQGITGGISQVESDLNAARQKAIEDRALRMQQFGIGQLSPEDIQQLGPTFSDPYASLYNLNLRDYLTPEQNLSDISLGQAASPEQIARYHALEQLGDRTGQLSGQLVPNQEAVDMLPLLDEQLMTEYGKRQEAFGQEFTPLAKFYEALGNANLQQGNWSNNQIIRDLAIQSGVNPALMDAYTGGLQRAIIDKGFAIGPTFEGETLSQMAQRGANTYLQNIAQQRGALNTVGQIAPEDVLKHLISQYSGQTVGALT